MNPVGMKCFCTVRWGKKCRQFSIDNILIVPSKNDFMNEIEAFVTVYTQIPTSNLNLCQTKHFEQNLSFG